MELNLKLARSIVASFSVDVKLHPEYLKTLSGGTKYCERNMKVGTAMEAIDELIKSL